MFKYSESIRNQFKNYHLKNDKLLAVFLDALGNTVIRIYNAGTCTKKNEINLGCKTSTIFFYLQEYLLAYFPLERLIRIDLQTSKLHSIEGMKFAPEILVNNNLFGIFVDEYSNKIFARLDCDNYELRNIFEEPFRLWGSNGYDVYGVKIGKGQEIYSINTLNDTINWVCDFGTELSGRVLSHGEVVLILGRSKLFGIHARSGKVLWHRESNDRLKLFADKLINVDASYYREICPDTGNTLAEYEIESEYFQHGFQFMGINKNFTVTDTHIFIVDAMCYKMGCINRGTGKIDWSVEVGEAKVTLPNAPIIYGEKLYVLDDEGTLHVYNRE